MNRREIMMLLGSAAAVWPGAAARGQQSTVTRVVALLLSQSELVRKQGIEWRP